MSSLSRPPSSVEKRPSLVTRKSSLSSSNKTKICRAIQRSLPESLKERKTVEGLCFPFLMDYRPISKLTHDERSYVDVILVFVFTSNPILKLNFELDTLATIQSRMIQIAGFSETTTGEPKSYKFTPNTFEFERQYRSC